MSDVMSVRPHLGVWAWGGCSLMSLSVSMSRRCRLRCGRDATSCGLERREVWDRRAKRNRDLEVTGRRYHLGVASPPVRM